VDHSADVAAVAERLLIQPTIRKRLATAAGRSDLDEVTRARLGALSFLHDIGKANRGSEHGWTRKHRLLVTSTNWRGFSLAMVSRFV
jgi:CRISPR-associated endonuclease/helicase Cas3